MVGIHVDAALVRAKAITAGITAEVGGKAVDLDVLKKYSSEANKDCEKFLSAVMSNNQSGILLHLTALVADLKILENEINK